MKTKDFQKLKNRSVTELKKDVVDLREKLWQTKREINDGKIKNVRSAAALRRDIAKTLTLIKEKTVGTVENVRIVGNEKANQAKRSNIFNKSNI